MGTQSHLPMIRLTELQTIGCHICPDVGEKCCGAGEDLAECLGVLQVPIGTMTALFRFSGDSGQIPLELWPSWRHEEENISSVTWCLPSRRLRSAICCQILSSNRRIYLRLPLLTQLDMEALLFVFGIQGTHSIFVCSCSGRALSSLLLEAFYAPEEIARSPEGVFGGRSLFSLCGPVGFRGVAPHHRPIHPEHFHRIPAISHGSLPHERSLLSVQGAVLRVDNCPSCLYTTDGSNIHHSTSLRCRDAPIPRRLVDSSRIQDHWYPGEGQAPASV